MDHQPGDIIHGRYRIISIIGKGGFGETYQAEDTQSPGLICLIKYLKPQNNSALVWEIAEKCFRKEADTMRYLGNYNQQIPQLYNYFEENQKFYLVQEYIEGQNLEEELRTQLFSETQVIEVLQDILKVLDFIHQHKVIHRDIKPANLIRRTCDNKIFLIDFGAVKEVSTITVNAQGQTISTIAIGTPFFMPHEQAIGKPKFASDIYALGITGIVLLTGNIPLNNQIAWSDVPASPQLKTILEKMVRSEWKERYDTAADVLFDLEPLTLVGQTLNQHYNIKSYLGGGGFGHTYLAEDSSRPYRPYCIIKQLKLKVNRQQIWQEAQAKFADSVNVVEGLAHPQLPRLLHHFQNNQAFYLVYDFIEGEVLSKQIIVGDRLSEPEVIALLKNVLEVLSYIHQQNVIHGDIKPSNLIQRQPDNKIILIDFAQFKQIVTLDINSQKIVVKPGGTDGYMPPEQLQNKLKPCSDIYALGMTAIQALTGVSPEQLPTDSQGEIIWRNQAQVSRKLARILNKMVRFQLGQRYQSAQEVLDALNDLNGWWWRQFVKLLPVLIILGVVSIGLIYFVYTTIQKKERVEKLYAQGLALNDKREFGEAIKIFQEALDIEPNIVEVLVAQGYAYGQLKEDYSKQQFYVCRKANEIAPNSSGALVCLGNVKVKEKNYKGSIEDFDKVISLACNNSNAEAVKDCIAAWTNKGLSLLKLQKPEDALKAFEQALAIKKDYKPAIEGKQKAQKLLGN
ncbi:serine/threonine-protein kinase [Iningainema tapete]|uniref:non-specific serine/threonine protein kinase n=1 Tax=Iningainema tapete BLCC-T55 TaxID=2748662 RepID=A0A8J6XV06_9CYAN|nr:serine/threonine-protein kinase [Iningainema tapete]MBD2776602.1 protein kinase [Iningainema tapete BLCC-T55]